MGFPVCYSELILPRLLIHFISLVTLLRRLLSSLLRLVGLPYLLDSPSSSSSSSDYSPASFPWPDVSYSPPSSSAALLREVLPVVQLSEIHAPPDSCAVCLYELDPQDEARRLPNCCHVFHLGCLDRWIGYGHRTCPLCRTSLAPDDVAETVNQGFWAASGFSDFEDDFTHYDLRHFGSPPPLMDYSLSPN